MSPIIGIHDISHSSREARFAQTMDTLPVLFPQSSFFDAQRIQLAVASGAFYLLDREAEGSNASRKVIISSDGASQYSVGTEYPFLKQGTQGSRARIHKIFDVTDRDLEAALAAVVASKYDQLPKDLATSDRPRDNLDGEPMGDIELLRNFGYTT